MTRIQRGAIKLKDQMPARPLNPERHWKLIVRCGCGLMFFRLGDTTAARSKSQWTCTNSLKRLLYSGPTFAVVAPDAGTSWSRNLLLLLLRASETRNSLGLDISSGLDGIRCTGIDRNFARALRSAIIQDSTSMTATRRKKPEFKGALIQD